MAKIGDRFKTGQQCDSTGHYDFDGYLDGTRTPRPTGEEMRIPLSRGETFPPVRSQNKGAWWKFAGRW